VRIYGDDLDTLQSKANEASAAIQGIKGVRSTSVENLAEQPGINIEVNLAAAQRYGVEAGDVRRQAAALLSGLVVGSLYEQEKIFDVVVWGVPQVRNNLDTIRNLLIDTPSGGTVKLSDVANVSVGAQPTAISHVGASRKLDVTVNVQGRQTSEVAEDIQSRLAGISMPLDYHAEVLGSYSQLETMQLWLLILGAAAVLGMFLLFQSVLASWRLALLGLLSSLVAVSGGIVAAFVMHRTVSPTALIALVPVFGRAARYAILLARDCRQYEEQALAAEDGPEKVPVDRQGLVVQTAGAHFGRVVMIIIAAAVLLLPLAIRGDIAGLEVLHEPIVMLLSSLVTLAFVDLFVAPALYARFGYSWRKHDANV
jgi:Cu/Ag efflux pump CusA